MTIIIDKFVPFIEGILEPYAQVIYADPADITPESVRTADALIVRTRTRCNEALLAGSRVRFIATGTIGYDHIDTAYCNAHGITWQNAAGCNADAVRQYVEGALHALADRHGFTLAGKTLGIVGVGHVGKRVAAMAERLGMRTLLCDPPRARVEGADGFVSLSDIAAQSDIVTFHTPLSRDGIDKTYHLCDAAFLAALRPEACIINAARGGIIDEQALLNTDFPDRSAIDCWEGEPRLNISLLDRVCIGTFHIAGYSLQGKVNATTQSVQGLARFFGWQALYDWCAPLPEGYNPDAPYDIWVDDVALRATPNNFEAMRDAYKLR